MQLHSFKREFSAKDATFLKLRNACAAQEFTFMQVKRYMQEQNLRMAYKVLGLTLPKHIKSMLAKGGADFSDYFPQSVNNKPGPISIKSILGVVDITEPATDDELRDWGPVIKEEEFTMKELEAELKQKKMEVETV